ncbi:hypothetical protein T265_04045 [Opisthorchis viverrini]|uniref:Uncharacterized protein n=1 Tax=Opisthorchis viverrini TaxID=6198 RepID=A0A075AH26_OPIVI|nr:hypothetical protein T265_04045 [Opisthorchis viverrini]KER29299.1 hypothetical protein T265_04045 [Opisthorchis viverrini]
MSGTTSMLNGPYAFTNYRLISLYRLNYFRLFVGIFSTLEFTPIKTPSVLQWRSKRNTTKQSKIMTSSESCNGHILVGFIAKIGRIVVRGSRKTSLSNRLTQHFAMHTFSAVQASHFSQLCFRPCRSQLILTTNDGKATGNRKANQ